MHLIFHVASQRSRLEIGLWFNGKKNISGCPSIVIWGCSLWWIMPSVVKSLVSRQSVGKWTFCPLSDMCHHWEFSCFLFCFFFHFFILYFCIAFTTLRTLNTVRRESQTSVVVFCSFLWWSQQEMAFTTLFTFVMKHISKLNRIVNVIRMKHYFIHQDWIVQSTKWRWAEHEISVDWEETTLACTLEEAFDQDVETDA